uniref:Uncharacterized protein n=1 Tax=viral metagenome TaxID=1070528 RepID=A0A6C0I2P3_9ZZZZ
MLFYGKEIDIFYIILLVIFILVFYILFSFYMQQKQTIALTTSSQPILSASAIVPIPIKSGEVLERGAFAISLWLNLTSWVPPTTVDASFNVLSLNNTTNSNPATNILTLYIDANCNLFISSTLFTPKQTYQIMSSPLPIKEPVNIIFNYNGDDDYTQDENEFLRNPDGSIKKTNNGKPISIYNTDTGFFYKNRALDVFINGMLNNTIILNTSLSKEEGNVCDNNTCVSYFDDASMNYFTNNNIQLLVGSAGSSVNGPIGTISNVAFIKGGCSTEDAQSINNSGNSSSILDNILSYKLRFSLLEDDKEVKVYDI